MQGTIQQKKVTKKVPKLRFPGFSDAWEEKKLGEIFFSEKGLGLPKEDVVASGKNECILYGELYTTYDEIISDISSRTNSRDGLKSKVGDLLIPCSTTTTGIDLANVKALNKAGILLGGDITVLRTKNKIDNIFYAYYLSNYKKKEIAKYAQGSTIVHLYYNHFKKMTVGMPDNKEQRKIAGFLGAVDGWIENLRAQKENFEAYKKGMMQEIFSQEIRFKDENGKDFPKWEEKKLGGICEIKTGKLNANAMKENGQYRFYTCDKDFFMIDKYAFNTEALLVSGNGANVGYIHYYKGKFNAYQRTYVLDRFKANIIFTKFFLDAKLGTRISKEKKAGNTPYIVLDTLSEMTIGLPKVGEQQKIAEFLTSIDKIIESKQRQITQAEQWKKGLMQELFV